jgi:hypothetical protein
MQRGLRHRQFASQVRDQPLVLAKDPSWRHRVRPRPLATALAEQTGQDPLREDRRTLRRTKALAVQVFRHLGQRPSGLMEFGDPLQEPALGGHLLVTLDRTQQLVAAAKAAGPVDSHIHPFALATNRDDDLLDQEPDDPLAVRWRRRRCVPQRR